MNLLELKEFISSRMEDWYVSIDEAEMVNIEMDEIERYYGVIYIEEFITGRIQFRNGKRTTTHYEVTFVVFSDIAPNAEHRATVRQNRIGEAMNKIVTALNREHGVTAFSFNCYPKGFDAEEITETLTFDMEDAVGC